MDVYIVDLPIPEQDTLFVEKAVICETFINLTVNLETGELSDQLKFYGIAGKVLNFGRHSLKLSTVSDIILAFAFRLSRLSNLKFDLPSGSYEW